MRVPNPENLRMLMQVAKRLDMLRDKVVFVGGAVVDLLITDPAAPPVRATGDVDIIVEVVSRLEYYTISDALRDLGFKEDSQTEGGPICRWIVDGIKVDTMPMKGEVLGFSNDYFTLAIETAVAREIVDGLTIRLISAPCFLATKLEAFRDRGRSDFLASSDMEDVIAVLYGRPEVVDEIRHSHVEIKTFVAETCAALLGDEDFIQSLPGHLEFDSESPETVSTFVERLRAIASIA